MYLILSVNKGEEGKHMSCQGSLCCTEYDWSNNRVFRTCLVFLWLSPITFTGLPLNDSLVKWVHLAWQQKEPWPTFPFLSISRHCCCEDEMSVLLKVQLKHNWTLLWRNVFSQQFWQQNFPLPFLMSRFDVPAETWKVSVQFTVSGSKITLF